MQAATTLPTGNGTVTFENSIVVRRRASEVFDYLADLENIPQWNYAIAETAKITAGPIGVGTRYRQTRTLPKPAVEEVEVQEFVPSNRLVIHGRLGPFTATLAYDLEEIDEGVIVRNVVELTGGGLIRIAAPLVSGRIKDAVAVNLDVLKRRLERG